MYYNYPNYESSYEQLVAAGSVTKSSRLCWITDLEDGIITLLTVGSSHINQIHLVLDKDTECEVCLCKVWSVFVKTQTLKKTSYALIGMYKNSHENLINNELNLKK